VRRPGPGRGAAVAAGLLADRLLGEPPGDVHPVAAFGTAMGVLERRLYADARLPGVAYTLAGTVGAALAGMLVGSPLTATYVTVAGRALAEAAHQVAEPLALGDLVAARDRLPALVGRDARDLDEAGIARAVVESVAENTTDAVIAPALWALVGGAPGALAYRAVNTMDAMVGHRSARYRRFGWASARLDDAANWVPARVTAALVAAARPGRAGAVWAAVRGDAPAHPSPNSGVAEAAFAAALGLQLGGRNHYGDRIEDRPPLGRGRPPAAGDIATAVALAADVERVLVAALLLAPVVSRASSRAVRALTPAGGDLMSP
jgi:adenosylcobinamide-phosphate synthase